VRKLMLVLAAITLAQSAPALGNGQPLEIRYYFSPECGSCTRFIDREVPRVEKLLEVKIKLVARDIRLPGVVEELDALLEERKLTLTVLPVLVVGETVLVGSEEITRGFETVMRSRLGRQ
jgi:hypothetical protein